MALHNVKIDGKPWVCAQVNVWVSITQPTHWVCLEAYTQVDPNNTQGFGGVKLPTLETCESRLSQVAYFY